MPTAAPASAPRAADPADQPTSVPAPIPAAVVPIRSPPAPAALNDEGRAGSMRGEHNKPCNTEKPHGLAESGQPCTLRRHSVPGPEKLGAASLTIGYSERLLPLTRMNAVSEALSSPRFNRILLWTSAAVLAVGVFVVVAKLAGGSDRRPNNPDSGLQGRATGEAGPAEERAGRPDQEVRSNSTQRRSRRSASSSERQSRESTSTSRGQRSRHRCERGYTAKKWANCRRSAGRPVPERRSQHGSVLPRLRVDEGDPARGRSLGARRTSRAKQGPGPWPSSSGSAQSARAPRSAGSSSYWMPRWTPPLPIN